MVCPAIDGAKGAKGAPSVFHSDEAEADAPAPVTSMRLRSSEILDGGSVWLRYELSSG